METNQPNQPEAAGGKKVWLWLLFLALALFITFCALVPSWVSSFGFSEDNIHSYARKYIQSRPGWIPIGAEAVIQDVQIQKMNLHDQELSTASVNVRLRGNFKTWGTLHLVSSPDYSGYLISNDEELLSEVDRDGYAQVAQRLGADQQGQPAPTSTVIYHEFPAPTKAP